MKLLYYRKKLNIDDIPLFLEPYLKVPSLLRLKEITYFCGMDYASKDIYDFKYYITRYDHSVNTALLTWNFTKDKVKHYQLCFMMLERQCFLT